MANDSVGKTFLVAFLLCLACSVLVSLAAVYLGPRQEQNKELERKKNILIAAGLLPDTPATPEHIDQLFSSIKEAAVPSNGSDLLLYEISKDGKPDGVVLPFSGSGLWSKMYGFIALESDMNTVKGLTFYEHGETPGLGGEVDNPSWKAAWPGRKIYTRDGTLAIEVIKGSAGSPAADPHRVDGLSGATITTRSVSQMIRHWLSDQGYGSYLQQRSTR